jgi:hypothetical protein
MIDFIEKDKFTIGNATPGAWECVPVFMVKDGVEYFVLNRIVNDSSDYPARNGENVEAAKESLIKTNGRCFKLHGMFEDPAKMISDMIRREHSFTEPENIFAVCKDKKYGAGFTDFHGNRKKVSAVFWYRLYDDKLVADLKAQIADGKLVPARVQKELLKNEGK